MRTFGTTHASCAERMVEVVQGGRASRRRLGDRGRAVVEAIDAVVLMVPTILGAPLLRHAYNRWGTTKGEGRRLMPGDELIEAARLVSTRSITIDAPPAEVWRWLVQIGQGRGGLYSYDALENAIGCDIHSADHVAAELQHLEVGDLVRLGPDGYPAFRVHSLEPTRSLVLVGVDPATHEAPPMPVTDDATTATTWSWRLTARGNGSRTRLVTRQRTTFPTARSVLWHVVEPISFVMERRMLLGIKQRAERSPRSESAPEGGCGRPGEPSVRVGYVGRS